MGQPAVVGAPRTASVGVAGRRLTQMICVMQARPVRLEHAEERTQLG
jgi:hypothetical protein